MKLSRRGFLTAAGVTIAANAFHTTKLRGEPDDWAAVRNEFDLRRDYIHLASFFLSSHPRPVREAIERYRKEIDRNPFQVVEHAMFDPEAESMFDRVKQAAGDYLKANPQEFALTGNTTIGLALIYQGLALKPNHEILTTIHDHYSHHESIRLAAARAGASVKRIALFDSFD